MTSGIDDPYLKYALFCRGTNESDDGELNLNGIVDLIDVTEPPPGGEAGPVLTEVDVNLAFCIGGALPETITCSLRSRRRGCRWKHRRPRGCNGKRESCSRGGSRHSASRCKLPASIRRPSCSTAYLWARPASWYASSRSRQGGPYEIPPRNKLKRLIHTARIIDTQSNRGAQKLANQTGKRYVCSQCNAESS